MSEHGWYSEQKTITGRWSPQITPFKPRDRTIEGRKLELRRVRQLEPHEAGMSLTELQANEDKRNAQQIIPDQPLIEEDGFVTVVPTLGPRDPVASGVGE